MKHCQIRSQLNLQRIRTHHVRANFGPSKSDHVFLSDMIDEHLNSNYFSSEQSQQWKPIFHAKYNNGGNSICVHDTQAFLDHGRSLLYIHYVLHLTSPGWQLCDRCDFFLQIAPYYPAVQRINAMTK